MLSAIAFDLMTIYGVFFFVFLVVTLLYMLLFAVRHAWGEAFKSLLYAFLISISTVIAFLPALAMHTSFTDLDRLFIFGWWLVNILLMILYAVMRARRLMSMIESDSDVEESS